MCHLWVSGFKYRLKYYINTQDGWLLWTDLCSLRQVWLWLYVGSVFAEYLVHSPAAPYHIYSIKNSSVESGISHRPLFCSSSVSYDLLYAEKDIKQQCNYKLQYYIDEPYSNFNGLLCLWCSGPWSDWRWYAPKPDLFSWPWTWYRILVCRLV